VLMLQPKSAQLLTGITGLSKCMLHPATPAQPYNAGTVVGQWRSQARRFGYEALRSLESSRHAGSYTGGY